MGVVTEYDEFTADLKGPSDNISGKSHIGTSIFNPVVDRHLFFSGDKSVRNISAGEEILDNYLAFVGGEEYWANDITHLRAQCAGETTEWSVTHYEDNYDREK